MQVGFPSAFSCYPQDVIGPGEIYFHFDLTNPQHMAVLKMLQMKYNIPESEILGKNHFVLKVANSQEMLKIAMDNAIPVVGKHT